jgi:hypothetical protein
MSRYRPMSRKRILTVAGAALLAVAAIAVATAFAVSSAPPATASKVPSYLSNPNAPFPTDARLNPTTAAQLHRDATARVEVATRVARDPASRATYPPTLVVTESDRLKNSGAIIAGTVSPDYSRPYGDDLVIENYYAAYANDVLFVVVAGSVKGDAERGFVGVATTQVKHGLVSDNRSFTPTKHGSVHITAVNGSLVTLVATDGTTFTFDYATYTFK